MTKEDDLFQEAFRLHQSGSLVEAAGLYQKLLEVQPEHAVANFLLGTLNLQQENFDSGITLLRKAIAIKPDYIVAYNNLGTVLHRLGRNNEAIATYNRALEINPDYAETHFNIGNILLGQNKLEDAVASFRHATALDPGYTKAHNNLGNALREQGKLEESMTSCKRALEINPNYAEAHNNIGIVLQEQAKHKDALSSYQKAVALKPDFADAHSNIGTVLHKLGRNSEAIEALKHAIEINPEHVKALGNLAELLEEKNKFKDAQLYVEKGLKLIPNNPLLNFVAAKLERYQERYQDAIKRLEMIKHAGKFEASIQHLLGQLKDKTGNTREAFEHFIRGNRLNSELFSFSNVNKYIYLQKIDELIKYFQQNSVSTWTTNHVLDSKVNPVFLLGFPRSGTTLLDKILNSHPKLQTLEEKPTIFSVRREIKKFSNSFPNTLASLTQEQAGRLRTRYLETASEYLQIQNGKILIDKMPLNTWQIPLILRIFPQAKIILSLRHPCDVCLSCFMQEFGANEAMANFLTLEDTANLYTKVMGLWKHYEEIFSLDYHIIKYEDLIVDFESETRKLLDFIGVEWNDNILKYDKLARKNEIIPTPSYHQVIKPIYQDAMYRWQRYADQLAPVMEKLIPFIKYFEYSKNQNNQGPHEIP